jgi:hypothetical protein
MKKTASQIADQVLEKVAISLKELRRYSTKLLKQHGVKGNLGVDAMSMGPSMEVGISHLSPQVIMEEGNLLRSLPRGTRGVVDPFRAVRSIDPALKVIKKNYPGYVHGTTRLSRHAIKRIGEAIQRSSTPRTIRQTQRVLEGEGGIKATMRRHGKNLPEDMLDIGPAMAGIPGSHSMIHSKLTQPIVRGGSLTQSLQPVLPEIKEMTGRQKEILNRIGILHEGIEGKVLRKLKSNKQMIEGWGKLPYQTGGPVSRQKERIKNLQEIAKEIEQSGGNPLPARQDFDEAVRVLEDLRRERAFKGVKMSKRKTRSRRRIK